MLTAEQARFFARNGFVQLSRVVPETTCSHLVERTWAALPPKWRRDAPASWRGKVGDSCHVAALDARGGLLKFQLKELAADPAVVASFQAPSPVHEAAHDLIGRPLHPIRLRGLYAIAPVAHPDRVPPAPSPHVEAHPAQIVALTYLEDVAPGGGGLRVWPGSHRDFYRAFDSKLDYVAGARFAERLAWWQGLESVELPGARGDVVLCHHRLLHSPSINRRDRIRFGFLCDYTPLDHHALCKQPPGPDVWEDWPGLVALAGAGGCAGDADFPRTPLAAPARSRRASRLVRWFGRFLRPAVTQSSRNKLDASRLVRSLRPGDVWLSVSDSPAWFHQTYSLDPKGSDLGAAGVRARLNGEPLASLSSGDLTARLAVRDGSNVLVLEGVDRPLWLRVVEIRLPFAESRVLVRRTLDGRDNRVEIGFASRGMMPRCIASTTSSDEASSEPLRPRAPQGPLARDRG
jgi:ectoine hydroxylase-related dioxygenase (phytanoyl-CoA dioxygenase family)